MTPLHQVSLEKIVRAQLHLVDGRGAPLSSTVQSSCENAYRWITREYPDFDHAQVANWAEEIGALMGVRGNAIASPKRYAYVALGNKLRNWLRSHAGRVELKGIGLDLELVAGFGASFDTCLDLKLLFEQLKTTLSDRDRDILILLLRDKSTVEIAAFLNLNYAAAAKAIQRVKDRISATVNGSRCRSEAEHEAVILAG